MYSRVTIKIQLNIGLIQLIYSIDYFVIIKLYSIFF